MKSFVLFSLLTIANFLTAQDLISLESYATGFSSPIGIENAGDDRLFIVERSGYIQIVDGPGNVLGTPFLDIDARVIFTGGFSEQGLLGLAFHPDYKTNGYFFVHYTDNSGDGQISRFSVQSDNPDRADADSELKIMGINQPFQNHNGGDLKFGSDGFLYIGLGDGGSANDPQGNGQDRETWLGKMLRIDVNNSTAVEPYAVPADNPFVNDASTLDEIWSIGLRNPWRYSFDRLNGDMYMGDVGQDAWAEVDYETAGDGGKNYGWKCYEANHTFNTSNCESMDSYDFPIHEYAHGSFGGPCSITGGYVYRGCEYADLYGKYIYADFCDGAIWALSNVNGTWTNQIARDAGGSWSSFGEGGNGALYICDMQSGIVHKVKGQETYDLPIIEGPGNLTFTVNVGNLPGVTGYQWYEGDEPIVGATSNTITVEGDGSLVVEVFTGTCSVVSEELLYVNVDKLSGVKDIAVSPNPFSDAFDLNMKADIQKEFNLELINIQGQKVWEGNWTLNGSGRKTIQVAELAAGVYYLKIAADGEAVVRKVTKQ